MRNTQIKQKPAVETENHDMHAVFLVLVISSLVADCHFTFAVDAHVTASTFITRAAGNWSGKSKRASDGGSMVHSPFISLS